MFGAEPAVVARKARSRCRPLPPPPLPLWPHCTDPDAAPRPASRGPRGIPPTAHVAPVVRYGNPPRTRPALTAVDLWIPVLSLCHPTARGSPRHWPAPYLRAPHVVCRLLFLLLAYGSAACSGSSWRIGRVAGARAWPPPLPLVAAQVAWLAGAVAVATPRPPPPLPRDPCTRCRPCRCVHARDCVLREGGGVPSGISCPRPASEHLF